MIDELLEIKKKIKRYFPIKIYKILLKENDIVFLKGVWESWLRIRKIRKDM